MDLQLSSPDKQSLVETKERIEPQSTLLDGNSAAEQSLPKQKPNIFYIIIGVIVLLIILVVVGALYFYSKPKSGSTASTPSLINCGIGNTPQSGKCFQTNYMKCIPAKLEAPFGNNGTTVVYLEILGMQSSTCKLKFHYVKSADPKMVNKDLMCDIDPSKSTNFLGDILGNPKSHNCSGPLLMAILSLSPSVNDNQQMPSSGVNSLDIKGNLSNDWKIINDEPSTKHPNTIAFFSIYPGFVKARKVTIGKVGDDSTSVIIDIGQFDSESNAKKVYEADSGIPDKEASQSLKGSCKSKVLNNTWYIGSCYKGMYAFPFTVGEFSFAQSKNDAIKLIQTIGTAIEFSK